MPFEKCAEPLGLSHTPPTGLDLHLLYPCQALAKLLTTFLFVYFASPMKHLPELHNKIPLHQGGVHFMNYSKLERLFSCAKMAQVGTAKGHKRRTSYYVMNSQESSETM
jgi:hypothetical protein